MSFPRPIRAVVFDMDGLLVDTEAVVFRAMQRATVGIAEEFPMATFIQMVGLPNYASDAIAINHFGEGFDLPGWNAAVSLHFREELAIGIALKAGVLEILAWPAEHGRLLTEEDGEQRLRVAVLTRPLAESIFPGKTMAEVAQALIPTMVAPAYQGPGFALAWDCMSAVPCATYRASIQALVTFEQRAALPTITVPTLCLAAEYDTTAPPEVMRRMAEKIPGAVFEVLADAGHLLYFEQPDRFNAVIDHFLKKQGLDRAE